MKIPVSSFVFFFFCLIISNYLYCRTRSWIFKLVKNILWVVFFSSQLFNRIQHAFYTWFHNRRVSNTSFQVFATTTSLKDAFSCLSHLCFLCYTFSPIFTTVFSFWLYTVCFFFLKLWIHFTLPIVMFLFHHVFLFFTCCAF